MTVRLVLTFLKVMSSTNSSPLIFPSIKFNFNTVFNPGLQQRGGGGGGAIGPIQPKVGGHLVKKVIKQ